MLTCTDPAEMSPDERFAELAAILAAGFLRLKRRTRCLPTGQESPHVSAKKSSEFRPESSGGSSRLTP